MEYDDIIVGGGSAGAVLAARTARAPYSVSGSARPLVAGSMDPRDAG
jgi:flavin-dependent dehydrogenase